MNNEDEFDPEEIVASAPDPLATPEKEIINFLNWAASTFTEEDDYRALDLCYMLAHELVRKDHSVKFFGSEEEDMKKSGMQREYSIDWGLDWMVVDDRYLFDPWSAIYLRVPRIIYDLQNQADAARVSYLYPDREVWDSGGSHTDASLNAPDLWERYHKAKKVVESLLT